MEKVCTVGTIDGNSFVIVGHVVEPSRRAFFTVLVVTQQKVKALVRAYFGGPVVILLDLVIL